MTRNGFKVYVVGALLCLAGSIQAAQSWNSLKFKPYVGLEYQYEHIKARNAFHPLLSANFQTGNLFLGTKFNDTFGVEIGYYRSLKTSQNSNSVFEFNAVEAEDLTSVVSRTSFKGFSFDVDIYYKLDPKFNVYALFGFVTMHPALTINATGSTDLAPALNALRPKNKTVPRLGIGAEVLEQHWGWRLRLMWVYTQNIQYDVSGASAQFAGITAYPYLQAVQATAGIFYRF